MTEEIHDDLFQEFKTKNGNLYTLQKFIGNNPPDYRVREYDADAAFMWEHQFSEEADAVADFERYRDPETDELMEDVLGEDNEYEMEGGDGFEPGDDE